MIRKQALLDFIAACNNQGYQSSTIVNQLVWFLTDSDAPEKSLMQETGILKEGEVVD